jgi:growth factor-regulated tyrosine kinase substrate
MDNLVSILKVPALNHQVKNTILRLVQNWSTAFEGRYALAYVSQVYKSLQSDGAQIISFLSLTYQTCT